MYEKLSAIFAISIIPVPLVYWFVSRFSRCFVANSLQIFSFHSLFCSFLWRIYPLISTFGKVLNTSHRIIREISSSFLDVLASGVAKKIAKNFATKWLENCIFCNALRHRVSAPSAACLVLKKKSPVYKTGLSCSCFAERAGTLMQQGSQRFTSGLVKLSLDRFRSARFLLETR